MKSIAILLILTMTFVSMHAHAISDSIKRKHPDTLLTDDYGILTENDLASFLWDFKLTSPFTFDKPSEHNIWQCFPRKDVMVTLSDTGESASDLGGKKNVAYLSIDVLLGDGVKHEYGMRRAYSIDDYHKRFNKWLKIMQGEKYVCLGGEFVSQEKEIKNGRLWVTYGWIFERLKTKRGCDTYFESCTPTYADYLQHKIDTDKMLLRIYYN